MNASAESNQTRAARYEDEKRRIIDSCFAKKDEEGALLESYITHVRVTEDAMYPSSPPPPDSPAANKKSRLILVAVRKSGRVRVHKARENPSGSFSIGKTWALDELTAIQIYAGANLQDERERIEKQWAGDNGFTVTLGKPYYWHAPTSKEKDFFIASLLKIYKKYTGGKSPELIGFLPHQIEQLNPAQAQGSRTPSTSVSQTPPAQFSTPQPPPPIPAANAQRPQSPVTPQTQRFSPAPPNRLEQPQVPPPRADRQPMRDGSSPMPDPLRSPARLDRRTPSRENMRRSPDGLGAPLPPREPVPAVPQLPRQQNFQTPQPPSLNPQSSQSSLEKQGFLPPFRPSNGIYAPQRTATSELSNDSNDFLPTNLALRNRSVSSAQSSERPDTATTATSENMDQMPKPPVPSQNLQLPDRKRPFLNRPDVNGGRSADSSRFVTPVSTPSARKEESSPPKEPPVSVSTQEAPRQSKDVQPRFDYFNAVTLSSPVQVAPTAEAEPKTETAQHVTETQKPVEAVQAETVVTAEPVQTPTSAPLPAPETPSITPGERTAEPEEISSPKKEDEARSPLSPAQKKKAVADTMRKAAFAVNAFKPRQGGGAARLKAMQEDGKRGNEPDGITGVVPAPLLRGMSADSVNSSRPVTPGLPPAKEQPAAITQPVSAPKVNLERTATEESVVATQPQPPVQPVKSKELLDSPASVAEAPAPAPAPVSDAPRPPTPDKARSRSPQRRKRQRQEADIAKYVSSLDLDPRIFEGRGADFNDLLTEFGWDGKFHPKARIDDLEADVRREIGRAQATGWLGHVDQQDSKVQELARAFDRAIEECEELDGLFTLYSHELDTLAADIEYIEAQSQGLQVQTANQKLLQKELQMLLSTLRIPNSELQDLHYGALDDARGVENIERALSTLYRALMQIDPNVQQNKQRQNNAGQSISTYANSDLGEMRAVREKKSEYSEHSQAFIRRFCQYMNSAFKNLEQSDDPRALNADSTSPLATQRVARQSLWLYNGIMLFVREVNSYEWKTLIKSYEMNVRGTYKDSFRTLAMNSRRKARKATGEEQEALFTYQEKEKSDESLTSTAARKLTVKRAKTTKTQGFKPAFGSKQDGKQDPYEIFQEVLDQQAKVIAEEQNFMVSYFHLSSQTNTDFVELVANKRPEERRLPNLTSKIPFEPDKSISSTVQSSIDSIYAFWLNDLQGQLEWALAGDQLQGVGVLCALEHISASYEDTNQEFVTTTIRTLHNRLKGLFSKFVDEQIKAIEDTKVKLKKRKGIISFMRTFPAFSMSVENMIPEHMVEQENLEIRFILNDAYNKILKAMWESINTIAKDDSTPGGTSAPAGGDPEDKEVLNYHILLIENMNHYIEEVDTHNNVVLEKWKETASQDMFTHLTQYTDAVIRRPLGKWLDFVESTEAMMRTNDSLQQISSKPSHSRSTCKKIIKSYDASEVRKGIETLKKRVEKHFGDVDDPTTMSKSLIARVLEECNARYAHGHDRMKQIIDKIYDGSLEIGWSKEEVATWFGR